MSSRQPEVAVALVENQGNLSKTLSALGSSSSVKSLATSMVIGGALAGFDKVMNIDVPPDKAQTHRLWSKRGMGKVVQRGGRSSRLSVPSLEHQPLMAEVLKITFTNALLANHRQSDQRRGCRSDWRQRREIWTARQSAEPCSGLGYQCRNWSRGWKGGCRPELWRRSWQRSLSEKYSLNQLRGIIRSSLREDYWSDLRACSNKLIRWCK